MRGPWTRRSGKGVALRGPLASILSVLLALSGASVAGGSSSGSPTGVTSELARVSRISPAQTHAATPHRLRPLAVPTSGGIQGTIRNVAGGLDCNLGYPMSKSAFYSPEAVASGASGDTYVLASDTICTIDPSGIAIGVIGDGAPGFSGRASAKSSPQRPDLS